MRGYHQEIHSEFVCQIGEYVIERRTCKLLSNSNKADFVSYRVTLKGKLQAGGFATKDRAEEWINARLSSQRL